MGMGKHVAAGIEGLHSQYYATISKQYGMSHFTIFVNLSLVSIHSRSCILSIPAVIPEFRPGSSPQLRTFSRPPIHHRISCTNVRPLRVTDIRSLAAQGPSLHCDRCRAFSQQLQFQSLPATPVTSPIIISRPWA